MQSYKMKSLDDLPKTASEFLENNKTKQIFAFYGKMGSGKTTFIKELCRQLGVTENVSSPTFALVNEYETDTRQTVYHFDFYRINNPEEALDMGFEDYVYGDAICYIEWPEKIENLLPPETVSVYIKEENNGVRLIELD